jgi:hypothetical protein
MALALTVFGYALPVVYLLWGLHVRSKGEIETAGYDVRTGRSGPSYVIRGIPVKILEFSLYLPLAVVVIGALLIGTGLVGTGWIGSKEWTVQERFLYVIPGIGLASGIPGVIVYRLIRMLSGQSKIRDPEMGRERYRHLYEQRASTPPKSEGSAAPGAPPEN